MGTTAPLKRSHDEPRRTGNPYAPKAIPVPEPAPVSVPVPDKEPVPA